MAEEILDHIRDAVDGEIDFQGQRRAENVTTLLLALTGLIAFNVGWLREDIALAVYTGLAGSALTFLFAIPPWPFFKHNPVKWLPAGSGMSYKTQ